ncbi:MAG TPA: trypsin-like peptidase domain-containing protein [candidate division Zixibacteria bacterium]|nr:trypsin-like peptidase domain-containing protein [candidate division Zixibacteria bacterium]
MKSTLTPITREKSTVTAKKLTERQFSRLFSARNRARLKKRVDTPAEIDLRRDEEDKFEAFVLEKVHKAEDFLPARFLARGAERSRAVCRVALPNGYGTGFLIARGYLMTNNHVLPTKEAARDAVAEFNYEEDQERIMVSLHPERFFYTSPDTELDFTIVACDVEPVRDVAPVQLLRNPATVTRHDRVNIIQHPLGGRKRVALHDNHVTYVLDKVIRYRTDTEPGSSGSAVFNNDWELVALHHAGVARNGEAENEGIRIAAIVAHLVAAFNNEATTNEPLGEILSTILDSSPYLGFFDAYGVRSAKATRANDWSEVEIPDYNGDRDFVDLGFWNIEHFNDSVSDTRVDAIADVVARLGMDVLGLVEVQSGALDRLFTSLAERGLAYDYVYYDAQGSQDIAALYDRDTTTARRLTEIYESYADELAATDENGKSVFPRYPLFAHCSVTDGNSNPTEFIMIVVHLKAYVDDPVSQNRRRLAAQTLNRIIRRILENSDNPPIVLGGDFNELLTTDVLNALLSSPDLAALTADDARSDALSYVDGRYRSLIDHIFVSNDVVDRIGDIRGDDAAIVRLDRSVADFAGRVSDHVPLVMRLVYRETPIHDPQPAAVHDTAILNIPAGAEHVNLTFD